jgi:hypothetical protein
MESCSEQGQPKTKPQLHPTNPKQLNHAYAILNQRQRRQTTNQGPASGSTKQTPSISPGGEQWAALKPSKASKNTRKQAKKAPDAQGAQEHQRKRAGVAAADRPAGNCPNGLSRQPHIQPQAFTKPKEHGMQHMRNFKGGACSGI